MELPRVRAVGASIVDEAWLAWVDDGTTIRPTRARGLAWIEPGEVSGLPAPAALANLRQAHGLAMDIRGRRGPARPGTHRASSHGIESRRARISPDGRSLSIEGTLLLSTGAEPVASFPLWIDQPGDSLASWKFRDESGDVLTSRPIEASALVAARVSDRRLGTPPHGQHAGRGGESRPLPGGPAVDGPGFHPAALGPRRVVSGRYDPGRNTGRDAFSGRAHGTRPPQPLRPRPAEGWPGRGRPGRDEGSLGVERPGRPRLRLQRAGREARALHRAHAAVARAGDRPRGRPDDLGRLPGTVPQSTPPAGSPGYVPGRSRWPCPIGPPWSASVATGPRSSPSGRGPASPCRRPGRCEARASTILIDYAIDGPSMTDGSVLRPELPQFDLPCLSFIWEIAAPSGWKATDCGAGLIANDRDDPADWPCGALGLWSPAWNSLRGRAAPTAESRLGTLDGLLSLANSDELTFAEWFTRWDSGPLPIVIDRLAIGSAGLGPKTPCVLGRTKSDRRGISQATLHQHGLALVSFARCPADHDRIPGGGIRPAGPLAGRDRRDDRLGLRPDRPLRDPGPMEGGGVDSVAVGFRR